MAIKAILLSDTFEYVSDTDPCKVKHKVEKVPGDPSKGFEEHIEIKEGATKFGLRPLDLFLMGHIYDNASSLTGKQNSDEVGIQTRVNQTNIDAVRFGLAYFTNFVHPKTGEPLQVETAKAIVNGRDYTVASDKTMQYLGIQLIAELSDAIKKASDTSEVEEKNSAGA